MRASAVPRKKDFKKGIDADDARRKREDNIIELRKAKRDEQLQKKRVVNAGPSYAMEESSARPMGLPHKQLDELPSMVQGLYSANPQDQYEATQKFRKLLSIGGSRGGARSEGEGGARGQEWGLACQGGRCGGSGFGLGAALAAGSPVGACGRRGEGMPPRRAAMQAAAREPDGGVRSIEPVGA
ncbi:Importin subunit alpha-2 [Monoraphidium neglectum]|uniref:Importin subunit alpha-2 n=1 Tax=Monoraphidium neglectum TaxID=145388 RepID=A0A0D2M5C1_9CHLO|nr:Importin subunit alpha-2 [Monoraphidium neglectum]KIY96466.1 Importin subunit alpha-2 [Monoraphidium neglectum]|eukprot:XP_013895486.1 Importin subunit alpha-2 [Monoraphidium neglectum]